MNEQRFTANEQDQILFSLHRQAENQERTGGQTGEEIAAIATRAKEKLAKLFEQSADADGNDGTEDVTLARVTK